MEIYQRCKLIFLNMCMSKLKLRSLKIGKAWLLTLKIIRVFSILMKHNEGNDKFSVSTVKPYVYNKKIIYNLSKKSFSHVCIIKLL